MHQPTAPAPLLPRRPSCLRPAFLALLLLAYGGVASAQTGANILVVANASSPDSLALAGEYAASRGVPPEQVVRLTLPLADDVEFTAFQREIQVPLASWLASRGLQDRILYIVLVKGVPLRIRGTTGRDGTVASVDSELALLYRRMTGAVVPLTGAEPNPYYLGEQPLAAARPFSRRAFDTYLVTRLDGYTAADVRSLIARGAAPATRGVIVFDQKPPLDQPGVNRWLQEAANRLAAAGQGDRVVLEATSRAAAPAADVLGYASWGSNDPAVERVPPFTFVPGAVAVQFVSTDARTVAPPSDSWKPGACGDRARYHAGSPQSLAGDLVRAGATGVGAQVAEPYIDGTIRPHILFPAYLAGFTLAEAFYLATPQLSWQGVVVGDPLAAPFPRRALDAADIDGGLDPATETPAFFASRRLAVLERQGAAPAAARALLRAESRLARNDATGARQALEEATAADPAFRQAQVTLAEQYQRAGEPARAAERYRMVLNQNPRDVVVLNNLAYVVGVDLKQPGEAFLFAERAFTLAPASPEVLDTYGWIQLLLGRPREAMEVLARAVRLSPDQGMLRLHAAVAYEANGLVDAARRELEEAIRLDAAVANTDDARALRGRLKHP